MKKFLFIIMMVLLSFFSKSQSKFSMGIGISNSFFIKNEKADYKIGAIIETDFLIKSKTFFVDFYLNEFGYNSSRKFMKNFLSVGIVKNYYKDTRKINYNIRFGLCAGLLNINENSNNTLNTVYLGPNFSFGMFHQMKNNFQINLRIGLFLNYQTTKTININERTSLFSISSLALPSLTISKLF